MAKAHYLAMSGSPGFIPDCCEMFDSREEAVSDLVKFLELTAEQENRLRAWDFTTCDPMQGAGYCQVLECECATPEIHSGVTCV
jgi:hypothetical protein